MVELVLLVHRQRVHVGPQSDRAAAGAFLSDDGADDSCLAHSAMMGDAEPGQLARDDIGGVELFEAELRVLVQIVANVAQVGVKRTDVLDGVEGQIDQFVHFMVPWIAKAAFGSEIESRRGRAGH